MNTIKKPLEAAKPTLKTLLLVCSVFMVGMASAPQARALSFYGDSFLNNGQDLQVFGTATNSYGQSNVYYKYNSTFGPGYSLGTYIYTVTNSLGVVEPVYGSYALFTNQSGVVFTNYAVVPYTNTSAIKDVPLWREYDGSFPRDAAIAAHLFSTNALAINTLTFRFTAVPLPDTVSGNSTVLGTGRLGSTLAGNTWSFTATSNGTNDVLVVTNLPTTAFQGSWGMRLTAVESATANGATNIVLRSLKLIGFH